MREGSSCEIRSQLIIFFRSDIITWNSLRLYHLVEILPMYWVAVHNLTQISKFSFQNFFDNHSCKNIIYASSCT